MRTRGLVAGVAVFVLAACGGSSSTTRTAATSSPGSVAPSASPVAPGTLSAAQLVKALLPATSLPPGYTRDKVTRGTTLAVSPTDELCARKFAALNTLQVKGPLAVAAKERVSFSKGTQGPFVRISLSSYPSAAKAATALAAVHGVLGKCTLFDVTNPKTQRMTRVALTPLPFPKVGNEGVAAAARLVTRNGPSLRLLMVYVRKGSNVAYVSELATGVADEPTLRKAVAAQVARLPRA